MNGYCLNCGSDGDVWICDYCGVQKCTDCITQQESVDGCCANCQEEYSVDYQKEKQ